MAAQQIGVVSATKGEVFARNAEGQMRRLSVGDPVLEGDVIVTAAGSSAEITPFNGSALNVGEQQTVALDGSVVSGAPPDASAGGVSPLSATEAARVIQPPAGGNQDFNTQVEDEAAAAGLTGGGADGGHSFVNLLRIVETIGGVNYDFPIYTSGPPPTIEGEPVVVPLEPVPAAVPIVSVSVQIGLAVGTSDGTTESGIPVRDIAPGAILTDVRGASVTEGNEGVSAVTFYITLDQVYTSDVTVTYQIVPGSADNPSDFYDGVLTGTVTIPAGFIGFTVTENIVGDKTVEPDENFFIKLLSAENATINPGADSATVTILNDDHAPVANDDANAISEDAVSVTGNVIGGAQESTAGRDTDQDGDTLTVVAPGTYAGTYGTLVLNGDGSYTYSLDNQKVQSLAEGQQVFDKFNYTDSDSANTSNVATLTVTITGTNDAPVITTAEGQDAGLVVEAGNLDPG
ncbi:MAG: retention module-containing protein, partial [Betaproteobacteria bacterium]|nr:retention module-containing protein [Betaproteobacteria bacterium]